MKEQKDEKVLDTNDLLTKGQLFFEKNGKLIIIIVCAVLVVLAIFFGLRKWYFQPREVRASEEMFAAEQWFGQGNYELALNGNEDNLGFVGVIDEYKCTKAGNLAKYYAGVSSLRMGNYDDAISYLSHYKATDIFTKPMALVAMADAQMEQGDTKAAVANYLKAAKCGDNFITAPTALFKAGMGYIMLGDGAKAAECFKQIKSNYPESTEWNEVDKYISYAENM
ncbi:MAG: tetratricopeptide repeat protein [Bacteroidales bacterium]|nr:tetratricopeptide repeat protein [Bacteroidales bacterium]